MSAPSPVTSIVMVWAGRLAFEAARIRPFIPTYTHLLASALFPIYIGAHASLSIPSSAAPPAKKKRGDHGDSDEEEPEIVSENIEGLTPKDAILFPLLAGLTLSSLYFIIKWLEDPSMLNKILSYYFMQVGVVFGTKLLKDAFTIMRSFFVPSQYEQGGHVWRVNRLDQRYEAIVDKSDTEHTFRQSPLPGQLQRVPIPNIIASQIWRLRALLYAKCSLNFHIYKLITAKVPVDILDALAIITSLAVVGFFTFLYKPWYVSNLLGFAFCYGSTQYMSPTTFWTGTLLLSALFFYDIYFVFFTPMMITVATKLDIPIKLLFPRPQTPAEAEKGLTGLSMLGLGDIVIPGMMIALALRFDLYLHYLGKSKTVKGKLEKAAYIPVTGGWGERFWVGRSEAAPDLQAKAFPKTYFKAGLVGYSLGMIVTLLVMHISEHGQPALLYLVPGVLGALWGTAAWKGDLDHMWNYTEDKEATKPKRPTKQTKEKAKEGQSVPTNATTEKDSSSASDSEEDSTTSESESESASDTSPSLPSGNKEPSNSEKAQLSKKEQERNRHLIWFSIEFPAPVPSRGQTASTNADGGMQPTPSNSAVEDAKKQQVRPQKPKSGTVKSGDSEPPGKRRRVA
jgi:minor histocompatibility antigen H13